MHKIQILVVWKNQRCITKVFNVYNDKIGQQIEIGALVLKKA